MVWVSSLQYPALMLIILINVPNGLVIKHAVSCTGCFVGALHVLVFPGRIEKYKIILKDRQILSLWKLYETHCSLEIK